MWPRFVYINAFSVFSSNLGESRKTKVSETCKWTAGDSWSGGPDDGVVLDLNEIEHSLVHLTKLCDRLFNVLHSLHTLLVIEVVVHLLRFYEPAKSEGNCQKLSHTKAG